MLQQVLGNGKRVGEDRHAAAGQEMHHLERRGAAVDDDRLAVLAEFDRFPRDGALLGSIERLVDGEGPAGKADELRRRYRLRTAAHPTQALLDMQGRDIAPDRRLGRIRQVDHLLHRHHRLFLDGGQNDPVCQSFPIKYFHCAAQYDRT
jgi:hypothetical protein